MALISDLVGYELLPCFASSEKTTYARKAKERLYLLYLKRIVIDAEITKGCSLPKTTTPTRGNSRLSPPSEE